MDNFVNTLKTEHASRVSVVSNCNVACELKLKKPLGRSNVHGLSFTAKNCPLEVICLDRNGEFNFCIPIITQKSNHAAIQICCYDCAIEFVRKITAPNFGNKGWAKDGFLSDSDFACAKHREAN